MQLISWQGVLCASLAVLAVNIGLAVISAIYNLFFHPLRRFKGPKLWIAFPFLESYARLTGRLDFKIREFHERYGEVIRLGPDKICFTTGQAWKDIYGHGHAELPKFFPKGSPVGHGEGCQSIISANAQNHFRFRRAMLPAFSDKALDQQESLIQVYVDLLVEKLRDVARSKSPTDLVKWYTFTTFDLIGDLAFGESFGGLESGKSNDWVANVEKMMKLFPILALAGASPLISKILLFLASDKIKNSRKEHMDMATNLAMKRIRNKDQQHRGDFMDFMLRSRGKEHGLSDAELVSNTDVLIVAGSETTATLLCGVTYYLLKNPKAMEKCVKEVRGAFQDASEISFKSASARLPYMLACLDEALRLFPPVPTLLTRQTLPGKVTIVDGYEIPEMTQVGVHQLSTFHSSKNFHEPMKFIPERWMINAEDQNSPFIHDQRAAFMPFSTGPRNCIGRNLAYHEMRLILASVLWHFDLKLAKGSENWAENQRTFALWEKPPLMVSLQERGSIEQ